MSNSISKYAASGVNTPNLDKFAVNMTKKAHEGAYCPAIGRDKEVDSIIKSLSRKNKPNVVLVGPFGVGKTAIAEHLALLSSTNSLPPKLHDIQLYELSLADLISGSSFRGQFEKRIKDILEEVKQQKNIVLFIDEIHTIMGLGSVGGGTMDASNILKPALARGDIRVIGATTIKEYKELENDGAFKRRFIKVDVKEPSANDTLDIIKKSKASYEKFHNMLISDDILEKIVKYCRLYINDRFSPDREFDVIDLLGASVSSKGVLSKDKLKITDLKNKKDIAIKEQKYEKASEIRDLILNLQKKVDNGGLLSGPPVEIMAKDLNNVFYELTGISAGDLSKNEIDKIINLSDHLKLNVIGQDEAIDKISLAVMRSRSGISRRNKPEFVGLLLGATGIGKTHLAKTLASYLYNNNDSFIRIDMSEYQEPHSVAKLIGSPPGYVGHNQSNTVFESIRTKNGRLVILLDEIEKANQSIMNTFLQVFDDGVAHDSNGNLIDFRNSIILMTSNIGAKKLREFGTGIGFNIVSTGDKKQDIILSELKKHYSPEVINRFDDVILFNNLSPNDIKEICRINVSDVCKRALDNTPPISLSVSDKLIDKISEDGFSDEYGGRFLNRAITTYIEDNFARFIFEKRIDSPAKIHMDYVDDKVVCKSI